MDRKVRRGLFPLRQVGLKVLKVMDRMGFRKRVVRLGRGWVEDPVAILRLLLSLTLSVPLARSRPQDLRGGLGRRLIRTILRRHGVLPEWVDRCRYRTVGLLLALFRIFGHLIRHREPLRRVDRLGVVG